MHTLLDAIKAGFVLSLNSKGSVKESLCYFFSLFCLLIVGIKIIKSN